jgi:hypothetical protein
MYLLFILIYSSVVSIPVYYYNFSPEIIREEEKGGLK